ncbi:hypothetical protein V500_00481 [Pseudogymnoascus sp. VKM F-4518 (FW-2643)]|nr:hypothetical protein V500_00481 [Pseudogymnoascus sp. VKM F-4518 (FW-2643)]
MWVLPLWVSVAQLDIVNCPGHLLASCDSVMVLQNINTRIAFDTTNTGIILLYASPLMMESIRRVNTVYLEHRRPGYTLATNTAAWLNAEGSRPFEVRSAPLWIPGENEILIRSRAIAVNPVDSNLQAAPEPRWSVKYPVIPGPDVAGVVVAVGPNVTRFKEGDRVLGHEVGMFTRELQCCAFQAHTIVRTNMASEIPDNISFGSAAVIPLGFSTSACGLFQDTFLNLQLPTVLPQKQTGKTLLILGGASSVGSNAIKLAVAAGYKVITTASATSSSTSNNWVRARCLTITALQSPPT